jgi:hypothetical protein
VYEAQASSMISGQACASLVTTAGANGKGDQRYADTASVIVQQHIWGVT